MHFASVIIGCWLLSCASIALVTECKITKRRKKAQQYMLKTPVLCERGFLQYSLESIVRIILALLQESEGTKNGGRQLITPGWVTKGSARSLLHRCQELRNVSMNESSVILHRKRWACASYHTER